MVSIKTSAINYVSPETKNIAELKKVSIDLDIVTKTFNEGTPEAFSVNVVDIDGEEYRVPDSVLKQLQVQLEANPKLQFFSVVKQGEGLKTKYTVVPVGVLRTE